MTLPLTTESVAAVAQEPVVTPFQSGWTLAQWLVAQKAAVVSANASGWSCGGGLKTTWEASDGKHERVTSRGSGESDSDLINRHFDEVAVDWRTAPPLTS